MSDKTKMTVCYHKVETLKPYDRNARTHSDKQIHQIAASIKQFGFNNPILIDDKKQIIAGHGRVLAAKELGLDKVPTVCLSHMSEAEKRAYIIADNRLAELAGWDDEILSLEFQHLLEIPDLDFDVEIIGFNTAEIDVIIGKDDAEQDDDADDQFKPYAGPAKTKVGDIWALGEHRLICGDSLEPSTYQALLGDEKADMCFTDMPFNVKIDGHVGNSGKIKHREFAMASGEMSSDEFTVFISKVFQNMIAFSKEGSVHYQCMDWRHIKELMDASENTNYKLINLCVWAKDNGGMGSLYRSQHELVFVFKNGDAPHINNIQLGKYGRYRTNVWQYAGVNTMKKDRLKELAMHPTVKPVVMMRDAIKDCSKRGQIILDPFGGSGSTLIAAEREGRQARLIEIDPHYCDTIINRWEELTSQKAMLLKAFKQAKEA